MNIQLQKYGGDMRATSSLFRDIYVGRTKITTSKDFYHSEIFDRVLAEVHRTIYSRNDTHRFMGIDILPIIVAVEIEKINPSLAPEYSLSGRSGVTSSSSGHKSDNKEKINQKLLLL